MNISTSPFETIRHSTDLCVVGAGLAGICTALAAARRGAKVVLVQDRPVLGGNSSSEIGVHIIGADRVGGIPHLRETGLLEELRLENHYRNPQAALSVWDLVLYDFALRTPNLTLLLNCSILDAQTDPPRPADGAPSPAGTRLVSVTGWQLSTQSWHVIEAKLFADCSGDGILAPLSGAEVRMGREGREEYGESIAPEQADERTMGMSYIFFTREHDRPMPFPPFAWARTFARCNDLPWGEGNHAFWLYSPWWCELGGEGHTIRDSETLRDDLLQVTMGLWDHIKNRCVHSERARNWALERVQFVPGRRESRRYVGPHVLTQNDIASEGRFDDVVAYGGWTMDDHNPAGFAAAAQGLPCTIHHPAPAPYGIPYGSLYSRNVANLYVAGRLASCTHAAMSSTRVMGTCASMGQAVGTAAALATREGCDPAGVRSHLRELQQMLLADDAYLPWVPQELSPDTREGRLTGSDGDPEPVRDGVSRQVGEEPHCWTCAPGGWIACEWDRPRDVREVVLALDSAMHRSIAHRGPGWTEPFPTELPRRFRLDVRVGEAWEAVHRAEDGHQRFVSVPVNRRTSGVRYTLEETWGAPESRVYAFLVNPLHRGSGDERR